MNRTGNFFVRLRVVVMYIVAVVLHPTRRATYHLHACFPGTQIVGVGSCWRRELYSYVGRSKGCRLKVVLVIYIYDTHNIVATLLAD